MTYQYPNHTNFHPNMNNQCRASTSTGDSSETDAEMNKIKCVFVGDGAVGKTSVLVSYTTNGYPQEYIPTAFDNYKVVVRVDEEPIQMQLCDTAGQNDFDSLRPLCYPGADVFLLCFSVINPHSFYNIDQHWIHELRKHAPNTPIILIGTQIDLRNNMNVRLELNSQGECCVLESEGRAYAEECGAVTYIECSALTQQNLKQVFDAAIMVGIKSQRQRLTVSGSSSNTSIRERIKEKLTRSSNQSQNDFMDQNGKAEYGRQNNNNINQSRVMYKRQSTSLTRLNHIQIAAPNRRQLPPTLIPQAQMPQKVSRLRQGWNRLMCMAKRSRN